MPDAIKPITVTVAIDEGGVLISLSSLESPLRFAEDPEEATWQGAFGISFTPARANDIRSLLLVLYALVGAKTKRRADVMGLATFELWRSHATGSVASRLGESVRKLIPAWDEQSRLPQPLLWCERGTGQLPAHIKVAEHVECELPTDMNLAGPPEERVLKWLETKLPWRLAASTDDRSPAGVNKSAPRDPSTHEALRSSSEGSRQTQAKGVLPVGSLPAVTRADAAPAGSTSGTASTVPRTAPSETQHVDWSTNEVEARARAEREGRPMIIHFTATWCAACQEMEKTTYQNPRFRKVAERFIALRIDGSDEDAPAYVSNCKRYGIEGLPAVVILDAAGSPTTIFRKKVEADELVSVLLKVAP